MYRLLNPAMLRRLLSLPNVIGIGIGYKEIGGKQTLQKGITVLVEKKVPAGQLSPKQMIPASIRGVTSDVLETGPVYAWNQHPDAGSLTADTLHTDNPRRTKWRPAPGGVSIGHYRITSGTLGAVVIDRQSGDKLILSNNHILANSTDGRDQRAAIGDPILQPGRSAGGNEKDIIARLYRFVPIKYQSVNLMDAAVAKPLNQEWVVPRIIGIGSVNGTSAPSLGMAVKKSGVNSGVTYSSVKIVNLLIAVYHGGNLILFRDQILLGPMSKPGDSGSLVLNDTNQAVGLLFGGSPLFTVASPISAILEKLNIYFPTQTS